MQVPDRDNSEGHSMAAEPNIAGMARLLYIVTGVGLASWGLWGADAGWAQWMWLVVGGSVLTLGLIGFSPLHAMLAKKE
jgi:hypothetical protein